MATPPERMRRRVLVLLLLSMADRLERGVEGMESGRGNLRDPSMI
ncbi:hypothetical protein GCM10010286_10500 [Streptomyces toxytricini]|nr:hypothetical protein GCM10010286_10500 [Streptomyces toxytricini]